MTPPPPLVKWAQRPNLIILTICVEDCKDPKIDVKPEYLQFSGNGGPEKKDHEVKIEFLKEIDPEKSNMQSEIELLSLLWKRRNQVLTGKDY